MFIKGTQSVICLAVVKDVPPLYVYTMQLMHNITSICSHSVHWQMLMEEMGLKEGQIQ